MRFPGAAGCPPSCPPRAPSLPPHPPLQEELEEALFAQLRQRGYGDEYVRRYQMVTRFFQQKRPLIILIAGSACTGGAGSEGEAERPQPGARCVASAVAGRRAAAAEVVLALSSHLPIPLAGKSSLAQQLASRLNMPNVLQTDVLYEVGLALRVCCSAVERNAGLVACRLGVPPLTSCPPFLSPAAPPRQRGGRPAGGAAVAPPAAARRQPAARVSARVRDHPAGA